jgi:hypothetical protein
MRVKGKLFFVVTVVLLMVQSKNSFAQTIPAPKQKIAVFVPLYLDSAFDAAGVYRFDKQFPKYINPGLEFYEGVQLALDTLVKENARLDVFVFDIKSPTPLQEQISMLDSVGLIIALATAQENWLFADEARKRKIPYINVNLPNDGGITNNPYFVMLNPSLKTHVEGVYRYAQKYYSLNTIVVFRKKGQMEDLIKNHIDDFSKTTVSVPLKYRYVDLIDSFTVKNLTAYLDSNKQNVCFAASLDDHFNRRLLTQLAAISKPYRTSIVGMPTFDNLAKDFTKPEFRGPEIIYGQPFYNAKTDKLSTDIVNHFNAKMYARPSDMVFRGYEVFWKYAKLLMEFKSDLSSNLHQKKYKLFTDFDIQPNFSKPAMTMEYFENKKLYFIRWQDGVIKGVN